MTKEEVERTFAGVSPYYAYIQGVQDAKASDWESFRKEAAKDILANAIIGNGQDLFSVRHHELLVRMSISLANELVNQLKEEKK